MKPVIIDVREPNEFSISHVKNSVNIPLMKLVDSDYIATLAKDTPIIVYCRSGNRSARAEMALRKQGFLNVTNGINQSHIERNFL